jgi:hypothetical protein
MLSRIRDRGSAALARLALVGADPLDDEDTRSSKALLVLISVLILPIALVWGSLYLAFGSPVGVVPLAYAAILVGAIVVFSRTRNFEQLLRVNLLDILLAPTLSMAPLGGFLASGGVGLWGILAPLGALVFSDVRAAARWYVAYVIVFLGSGLVGEVLGGVPPTPPGWFTSTMLALNVVVGGTIVFTLLALFAKQRHDALSSRARAPGRDQLRPGRGRRHRPEAVPLRPVGRCREHRKPDGIAWDAGADPGHSSDLRAAGGRVRVHSARDRPRQGQGRDGCLVCRRPTGERCPSRRARAGGAGRGSVGRLTARPR